MRKIAAVLLLAQGALFARETVEPALEGAAQNLWLTGPILCPSAKVVPTGHQNFEPYLYWTQNRGVYDTDWDRQHQPLYTNAVTQFYIQLGVAPAFEVDLSPFFSYNRSQGESDWRIGDLPFALAFQLLNDDSNSWAPAIKLRLAASVPIGKYDHLNPHKEGTDIGGNGNWNPSVGLVFGKLIYAYGIHFLATRLFVNVGFTAPVDVRGLSTYGGVRSTHGTVYPGVNFTSILGLEYNLSQNWALALDVQYFHQNKRRFSGKTGGVPMKAPSRENVSLAPAIEYNWNTNLGLIAGPWFSVAGRNSIQFISYVVALNIYH